MSVNKVILLGNVGQDVEFKKFDNGGCVARLSMATTERKKEVNGKEIPERTEWHNIVLQGRLAEVARDYVKKGDKLYVEGKIRYRQYESNGEKKYITEIYCNVMEMLSVKKGKVDKAESSPVEENNSDLPFF